MNRHLQGSAAQVKVGCRLPIAAAALAVGQKRLQLLKPSPLPLDGILFAQPGERFLQHIQCPVPLEQCFRRQFACLLPAEPVLGSFKVQRNNDGPTAALLRTGPVPLVCQKVTHRG